MIPKSGHYTHGAGPHHSFVEKKNLPLYNTMWTPQAVLRVRVWVSGIEGFHWTIKFPKMYVIRNLTLQSRLCISDADREFTGRAIESWGTHTFKRIGRVAACSAIETRAGATHVQIILTIPPLYNARVYAQTGVDKGYTNHTKAFQEKGP